MSDAATQFLTAIVPNQDLLCIAHNIDVPSQGRRKKGWTQRFFTPEQAANGALVNHLSELKQHKDTNVYFSVATFKISKREAVNATGLKCILLDVDLKGDRPHYETKGEAVRGLAILTQTITCLPVPWIIDSGNGIHAYFVFDETVSMDRWHVVATTFAKVAEDVDARLLADPKPTKDAARVMRVPATWNAKQAKRMPVKVLKIGTPGKFEDIKAGLATEANTRKLWVTDVVPANTPLINSPAPTHAVSTTSTLGAGFNEGNKLEGLSPRPIMEGCKQMHRMMKLRGNVSEGEWFLMIRVLNTCDKADQMVHTFSKGHPGYSHAETTRKLAHARTLGSASASCAEFKDCQPKYCRGCKFEVWSPSNIAANVVKKEVHEQQVIEHAEELKEGKVSEEGFLPMPAYYNQTRVAETHAPVTTLPVWKKDGDEAAEQVHKPIIGGHINVIGSSEKIEINGRGQETVTDMMIHMDVLVHNRRRKLAISAKVLTDTPAKATEDLRAMGMTFETNSMKESQALSKFFATVVQVAGHRPVPYFYTKGWSPLGLTVGAVQLRANQKPTEGYSSGQHHRVNDSSMERFCSGQSTGSLGKWKQAMSVFDGDHPHAHLVLLSGLANILLPLASGMSGGIVLALTGESGTGKTTLINFMSSFIGHPLEGTVQGTSTEMVMLEMLKAASVFMLPIDDLTSMNKQSLTNLLTVVSSGIPRQRLETQKSGAWSPSDGERINASVILTSNLSAASAFMAAKGRSEGLQMIPALTRQLEIPAADTTITDVAVDRWDRAKALIREHHGHALRPFCQYVLDNKSLVEKMLDDKRQAFTRALTAKLEGVKTGQFRYWTRYLAGIAVTGEILTDLGLINWNQNNIIATGIGLAVAQQTHAEQVQETDADTLWDLLTNDDNGRININLSEYRVDDDGSWPAWEYVDPGSNRIRGKLRLWQSNKSSMFQQITNRVINDPRWRIMATEVCVNGQLDSLERQVYIKLGNLRYHTDNDALAASSWEELYLSLLKAGVVVRGLRKNNVNMLDTTKKFQRHIRETENNRSYAEQCVELTFPPIKL